MFDLKMAKMSSFPLSYPTAATLTMSCWGIPSVMTTTKPISASMASNIARAATGGGTNIMEASQFVASLA